MQQPPSLPDEKERLAALAALDILDTAADEHFDRLTRLAKQIFGVPIALVSLVDTERQWFKSRQVLDASLAAVQVQDHAGLLMVAPRAMGGILAPSRGPDLDRRE